MSKPQSIPEREHGAPDPIIKAARFRPPSATARLPPIRIAWARIAIGALIVLWILTAWFVFTARSVTITATPANASIDVEELLAPRIGYHWLLRPGPRRVRVAAPGHVTFAGELTIGDAQIQTHEVALARLPGHLRISIEPAVTAAVYVDGAARGGVPGTVRDIAAGEREIEIRAARYRTYHTTLGIEGKGIEQSVAVALEPAWADFTVDSRPTGATVTVDDQRVGTTPLAIELIEGRRVVRLSLDGYKTWQQTLKVVAGTPVKLGTAALDKADGRLQLSSTPPGANVTIDGEFVGRTPLEAPVSPDKAHRVRLLMEGYVPSEQDLTVGPGKRETRSHELVPELATIQLMTTPADAELLVDGQPRGSATQTLDLPTRDHEIIVRSVGYATYQTTVTPRKGVEKRFRIRLKTVAEAAAAGSRQEQAAARGPARDSVTTFAGQELRLFEGGSVVLGSAPRDGGRRPDETQRQIRLERPFYLSVKEVTNAQFRLFLANHVSAPFNGHDLNDDLQPAAGLGWETAALYCNWLSRRDGLPPFYQIKFGEVLGVNPDATGYRLPTEAEWEWAARVPPGSTATIFAWGDRYPPQGRSGNYADAAAATLITGALSGYNDGFAVAAPVGSFTVSLRGLYDMGGNVAEWVHDYYDAAPDATPALDPLGPPSGTRHVIKGASWAAASVVQLRLAYRDNSDQGRNDVGFRLARYAQ